MKERIFTLFFLLIVSVPLFAQRQITKFMGIPVDGFKKEMIHKLEAKGFERVPGEDYLEGEFNGESVNIFIKTNNNKVWRIAVADKNSRDEAQIKVRFNNLCYQFKKNERYTSFGDEGQTIPDDENISYEMSVNNKLYQAYFYQESEAGRAKEQGADAFSEVMREKYGLDVETLTQVFKGGNVDVSKVDTTSLMAFLKDAEFDLDSFSKMDSAQVEKVITEKTQNFMIKLLPELLKKRFEELSKRSVWFNIFRGLGGYNLMLFYDNEYNHADGSDL